MMGKSLDGECSHNITWYIFTMSGPFSKSPKDWFDNEYLHYFESADY